MRFIFALLVTLSWPLTLFFPSNVAARPKYKAYKVTFPTYTFPTKLNNLGQVLITPQGTSMAPLIYQNDTTLSLPGFNNPNYTQYFALALNDSGYVVGDARYTDFSGSVTDPWFWNGTFNVLDENPPGINNPPSPDPIGYAVDINNSNDVIGQVPADSGWARAVIWYGGTGKPTVIGTLGAYHVSWARALNESGEVVCDADQPVNAGDAFTRAFLWSGGAKTELMPLDGQATSQTWALDINSSGWVVGRSSYVDSAGNDIRAALWRNGTPVDLIGGPTTGANTVATALNDSGMIILSSNGYDGRLWYNDSLWLIDSLVVNDLYDDGSPVPFVDAPLDINDRGDIITHEGSLLIRLDEGNVVNSEGDADDNDLSDDRCYTGHVNSIGADECTLRAAIEQANATTGRDTIRFNIPVSGIPTIRPSTPLPAITETVNIDARTQPTTKMVTLDGSNAPAIFRSGMAATDGITISADSVEIRGFVISSFSGFGLNVTSGKKSIIESNVIGANPAADSARPNLSGGILLSGGDSTYVGDDYAQANTIVFNQGPGISITSGSGNHISRNVIHSNSGLGIDLGGDGVTLNDPMDADTGPNGLVNYPLIDSASISGGATRLYGKVLGAPFNAHKIEFFFNTECDPSGYGEGEQSLWTISANTDANGFGDFTAIFSPQLPANQFITMTATDQDGNTSEFSPCWPLKLITLIDGNGDPIGNRVLVLSRVTSGGPAFDTTFVDSIMTDSTGTFDATDYVRDGRLRLGDTLKFSRLLRTTGSTADSAYSVHLDNAKFDSLTYEMYYDTLSPAPYQTIAVDHSTFAYNLIIAITWDATVVYWDEMQASIRKMANYLYDVSDGQITLDTVTVVDDALPDLTFAGSSSFNRPVLAFTRNNEDYYWHHGIEYLPRRWFLPRTSFPDSSAADYPVTLSQSVQYRFVAKLFMRTVFGLESEVTPPQSGCPYKVDMGMMGWPYAGPGLENPGSSELSWSKNYSGPTCKMTPQWRINGQSCWDQVEKKLERYYDGFFAPIIKPDERYIPSGRDYFEGPNANVSAPDLDVGAKLVFPSTVSNPAMFDRKLNVETIQGGYFNYALVKTKVTALHPIYGPVNTFVTQGRTDGVTGQIWLLGLTPGDSLMIAGNESGVLNGPKKSAARAAADSFSWAYASMAVGSPAPDSFAITTSEVSGSYPLICKAAYINDSLALDLFSSSTFNSAPTLEYQTAADTIAQSSFSPATGGYEITLSDYSTDNQTMGIYAPDNLDSQYFFFNDYAEKQYADTMSRYLVDVSAHVRFSLDSLTFATKAGVLSSSYPAMRNGLDSNSYAVSNTYALALSPQQNSLTGSNQITIDYNLDNVPANLKNSDFEQSIRIFHWNEATARWDMIAGDVDTASASVSAAISSSGVFAAFNTNMSTGVEPPSAQTNLPRQFNLAQNYPNPFNPTTTIELSLPRRGHVTLEVFNILGQTVRSLLDETRAAGNYQVIWDGTDNNGRPVSTGIYFYRAKLDDWVESKKMLLLK